MPGLPDGVLAVHYGRATEYAFNSVSVHLAEDGSLLFASRPDHEPDPDMPVFRVPGSTDPFVRQELPTMPWLEVWLDRELRVSTLRVVHAGADLGPLQGT